MLQLSSIIGSFAGHSLVCACQAWTFAGDAAMNKTKFQVLGNSDFSTLLPQLFELKSTFPGHGVTDNNKGGW